MPTEQLPLYTIGHSTRTLEEFIALLQFCGIQTLVDVRAVPLSQRNPQFNEQGLRDALGAVQIAYHWAGRQLGGRRAQRADSTNIALESGLRGYADYMQGRDFPQAAAQLVSLMRKSVTAIMCAEHLPVHCHRSLIADYLILQGHRVIHLIDKTTQHEHQSHTSLRRESAALIYDRFVSGELHFHDASSKQ